MWSLMVRQQTLCYCMSEWCVYSQVMKQWQSNLRVWVPITRLVCSSAGHWAVVNIYYWSVEFNYRCDSPQNIVSVFSSVSQSGVFFWSWFHCVIFSLSTFRSGMELEQNTVVIGDFFAHTLVSLTTQEGGTDCW